MSSTEHPEDLFDDETSITEITFLPDGRLCLFGASREMINLLHHLKLGDKSLDLRFLNAQPEFETPVPHNPPSE